MTTETMATLGAECRALLDSMEKLVVRVNSRTAPTVPEANRAAHAALCAGLCVVHESMCRLASRDAYAPDNEEAIRGYCGPEILPGLPSLDSLSED